jgi:hypothetical protein
MAFPQGSISIKAARSVFPGVDFREIQVGGVTVAYSAEYKGHVYENQGLTKLCAQLWLANAG